MGSPLPGINRASSPGAQVLNPGEHLTLLGLPHEILARIISELPPTLAQVNNISLVCRRLYAVSQQPAVWIRLFNTTPGFNLTEDAARRAVATSEAPGVWKGRKWRPNSRVSKDSPVGWGTWLNSIARRMWAPTEAAGSGDEALTTAGPPSPLLTYSMPSSTEPPIPVHYPTLYRARCQIQDEMMALGLHYRYDPNNILHPEHLDSDSSDSALTGSYKLVYPNYVWSSKEHRAKVYAARVHGSWVISGSRDKTVRIWELPALGIDGDQPDYTPDLAYTIDQAHDGSVLCLEFVLEDASRGGRGLLVTGSGDHTAKVWEIDWGRPGRYAGATREGLRVTHLSSLRGHTDRVAAVGLTKDYVVTASHDHTVRVYERDSTGNQDTVTLLHIINSHSGPLSAIAFHPDRSVPRIVSVATDGRWIVTDLRAGDDIVEGNAQKGFGSVDWKGHYIVGGCTDGSLALFSSSDGSLIRTFQGQHDKVVRGVLVDITSGIIVSGGHDQQVHFWSIATGECTRSYEFLGGPIFDLTREGMHLAGAAGASAVFVVTYGTGMPYLGLFA